MDRAEKVLHQLEEQREEVAEELDFLDGMIERLELEMRAAKPKRARKANRKKTAAAKKPRLRLTKDQTPLIELLREAGEPMTESEIAKKLGVSQTTVGRVVRDFEGDLLTVARERGENGGRERKLISLRQPAADDALTREQELVASS
jgi:Fic family protein